MQLIEDIKTKLNIKGGVFINKIYGIIIHKRTWTCVALRHKPFSDYLKHYVKPLYLCKGL